MGKTKEASCIHLIAQKHPHVHGEDEKCGPPISGTEETPPRAWGRLLQTAKLDGVTGNTPTCMGKTASSYSAISASKKHPHVHGDDPVDQVSEAVDVGNTPTCMGKTRRRQE